MSVAASPLPDVVSFAEHDLQEFSIASGDRNPLHVSEEYARSTPYGQRVVFGCLGALACWRSLGVSSANHISSMEVDFLRPIFLGVSYRVRRSEDRGKTVVQLLDGDLPLVSVTVTTTDAHRATAPLRTEAHFEKTLAARREPAGIIPGLQVTGRYAPDSIAVSALCERWSADPFATAVLCWSSYLIGMELPGESALFSELTLQFDQVEAPQDALRYQATVAAVDPRLSRIRIEAELFSGADRIAGGNFAAFVRLAIPEETSIDTSRIKKHVLEGKTAVLIGSSRGLGAALMRSLELRGAAVYSLSRSRMPSDRTLVGDAANTDALKRLRERALQESGSVDLLICNAAPAILPLRLEPHGAERIASYIQSALALTVMPLCWFLELLNASRGCAVLISSAAVAKPVREWPHYLAAKNASEMLLRTAALQFPNISTLVVRPPKLLTSLTNTPLGRLNATPASVFAERIAEQLERSWEPGSSSILE